MKKRYYLKEKKRLKRVIREEERHPSFEKALIFFSEMLRYDSVDKLSWLEMKWKQGK